MSLRKKKFWSEGSVVYSVVEKYRRDVYDTSISKKITDVQFST